MARTAEMKFLELIVLKDDISPVVEYIGKKRNFQFVTKRNAGASASKSKGDSDLKNFSADAELFSELKSACLELQLDTSEIKLE